MPAQPLDVFSCDLSDTRLIEASAGTGKTWALCGLALRLLLERGLEVQQVLVVTFTKAATAELRERIRSRIAETLARLRGAAPASTDPFVDTLLQTVRARHALPDAELAARLDRALQTFDEASIFTIHGFCQRALADTPFVSGLPLQQELVSDDLTLRLEVVHDFWRRHVAGDELPPALAAHLLARKDSPERWDALLRRQCAKPLSQLRWPAGLDDTTTPDAAALAGQHAAARASWQAEREAIVGIVREALPRLNANSYKDATLRQAAEDWDTLLAAADPLHGVAGLEKLHLLTADKLKPRKGQQPPAPHRFFDQAGALLGTIDATRQALERARLRLLRRFLAEAPAQLRALKRERRVVAFDDMLYNLHERLSGDQAPDLAAALRARFPAALIDEFQDTDPLQFAIFDTVYRGSGLPLFLVGDPKQAIYSFRNADLHTYLQAREQATAAYTLIENQRSTQALLEGLNALFGANPGAFVQPGLDYQPVRFGRKPRKPWHDASAPCAPLQLWTLPGNEQGLPLPKAQARQAAAAACAGEIARLLGAAQQGRVQHDGRPLSGGDVAVLVKSHAQGALMRQALAALGVGSVELSQASVYRSPDAEELERVLAAVLEPTRLPLLRAALATTLFGFDAAALAALAADEAPLLARVTRFSEHRDQWQRRGLGVMLRRLLAEDGVAARLLMRADGERRLTNQLHLAEGLQQASPQQPSPEALLRWLQAQRQEPGSDDAAQLRLESDRNLVQIVTIHKSKGLEYPVVFCPFLWDGHAGGAPAALEGREYHDDAGLPVLDFGDVDDAIRARIALERAAENQRLVYVALTRAVQRCVLVVGSYANRGESTAESGRSRLNWLVAGAGRTPQQWSASKPTPAEITQAWQTFAAAHPDGVGLAPLPAGPWPALAPAPTAADTLAALPAPAAIAPARWIASYSSLTQGVRHEAAAADHDGHLPVAEEDNGDGAEPDADDILHFPRGTEAGSCLHAVFEQADFGDASTWPAAIDAALQQLPPGRNDSAEAAARWPRMLQRLLADVLSTKLPAGLALRELPRARRLVELEFMLPAPQLGAAALAAALHDHGYPVPALDFQHLQGHLRGFIDLVFEHDGRFHLLDWKSNHLGRTPAAYAAPALAAAMRAHGYHLQALLYAVALHRHLQQRLPGYAYERHFGSVIYLFVRGVRPGWTGADGHPAGVHVDRPPLALIERLSALLAVPQEQAA